MKIKDIYNLSIQMGMDADPRGRVAVEKALQRRRSEYEKMDHREKEYFDLEALSNPYADTRIHFGDLEKEVRKVLAGIDVEGDELLVASKLGDIDVALAHHPRGRALLGLDEVMHMQADVLAQYGVPINVAEGLLHARIAEVSRSISSGNHYRVVEIARLLQMPYLCAHTVTDNLVFQFLKTLVERERPETVESVLEMLMTVPEYQIAKKFGSGPRIFAGKKENRAGRIAVTEITGGTEGAHDVYEKMANAGIGTVLSMHQSEKHREFAEKAHINVVIAGHMSSDSVGMNLFLDKIEERGVEIVPCGGLTRISRRA